MWNVLLYQNQYELLKKFVVSIYTKHMQHRKKNTSSLIFSSFYLEMQQYHILVFISKPS